MPACDLCGNSGYKVLYSVPDLRFRHYEPEYSVVECLKCGHRFLSPRPTIGTISQVYPESYYAGRSASDPKQTSRYLKQAGYLPDIQGGKILDIGCAGGGWLKTLQDKGWECHGMDFIKSPYQEENIDIRHGYLPESYNRFYSESFFDVISAWGVMEHIHNPSEYFRCINWLLKDKGIFIFMVPNGDSLWSRWAYKEDIHRHLHFFRSKTLRLYTQKYGFKVKRIEYTNDIYSLPATGRGLFKRRLLKMAGAQWEEITGLPHTAALRLLGKAGSLLDYCLIHPKIEEFLGLCGNIVVVFAKENNFTGD
ncbi:MAG: class I SAM-dependent methyltransferase [Nitrospirae bacterium]|nr:class I SAM-dependent methyltransferase [Nitrospirota bacterium]